VATVGDGTSVAVNIGEGVGVEVADGVSVATGTAVGVDKSKGTETDAGAGNGNPGQVASVGRRAGLGMNCSISAWVKLRPAIRQARSFQDSKLTSQKIML
jgi:hypothetical protein